MNLIMEPLTLVGPTHQAVEPVSMDLLREPLVAVEMGEPAEEPDWQERALCAQTDPEAFFPEKGGSTREAKRICSGCEVRAECLEYALAQRRALRHLGRALRAGAPPAAPRRRLTLPRADSGVRGPEPCRRRVRPRALSPRRRPPRPARC